ncbi:MAG: bifunctional hydroxymethylpyrimidine kinase/phosphomethylpyrimidine kinase [Acidobacteriaceae bacterium]|nr:bifunctional hydroxymethylpyrimidine kinase/phosphomethylpyrimidine kinase [Acidobacteriaceae bacterium]
MPTSSPEPVIMTVSGFDPLGGAGVIADLKTFGANGCYGVAAITAIDVQDRASSLDQTYPVDVNILRACLRSIFAESRVKAIKIGMLATRANAEAVLEILEEHSSLPVVLDPLVRASGGIDLKDTSCVEFVRDRLLPRATVITPNLREAAALTGLKVEDVEDMKLAARKLIEIGARAVVVTGGHLERPVDVFADSSSNLRTLAGDRIKPENIYGAACTFSSALTACLALGHRLDEAIILAKAYVTETIRRAYPVGDGRVPLNQLYRLQELTDSALSGVKPVQR